MGWGNKNLIGISGSHDQDGCHRHSKVKPFNISGTMDLSLCVQMMNRGLP